MDEFFLILLIVAEIPYHSNITEHQEMLPFSIAVMATAGKLHRIYARKF